MSSRTGAAVPQMTSAGTCTTRSIPITTVSKLAVSPRWNNYGLRIFGYLHPYVDGEFVFALGSDDNSELWLSADDSPLNSELLAWVGKTGSEWTTPGEFEKYASQTSRPVWLSAQRRYFFEVIHKQNDRGTDHVEVAWQLLNKDFRLKIIESKYISLYTDESALLISDVAHIPQTAASNQHATAGQRFAPAEMLRDDPRDAFYQVQQISRKFLEGVLPDCSYKPSYTIKDYPLSRYQGLQFIHMSYIYPNDYTRLTHMETQDSCFYPERPYQMAMFGFSRYMKLDLPPDTQDKENGGEDFAFKRRKSIFRDEDRDEDYRVKKQETQSRLDHVDNALFPDYGDDFDDYALKRRRRIFSVDAEESDNELSKIHHQQDQAAVKQSGPDEKAKQVQPTVNVTRLKAPKKRRVARVARSLPPLPVDNEPLQAKQQASNRSGQIQRLNKSNRTQIRRPKGSQYQNLERAAPLPEKGQVYKRRKFKTKEKDRKQATTKNTTIFRRENNPLLERQHEKDTDIKSPRDEETHLNMDQSQDLQNDVHRAKINEREKKDINWSDTQVKNDHMEKENNFSKTTMRRGKVGVGEEDSSWLLGGDFEDAYEEETTPKIEYDTVVSWNQTFQVNLVDLQAIRSDWIDLKCNISGNLLLHSSDALPIVTAFMEQLNAKHNGQFTLMRVINVVKRVDGFTGSRYLLELELKDVNGRILRLSHYIYALIRQPRHRDVHLKRPKPQILLCNPVGFRWNPSATVHFIVPVKNQARWVQQLIVDMEWLYRQSGDANFNLIITDYNSTDMDVRKALEKSSLPRYQYIKLSGNFKRSAGLQAGIDLIDDDHSIVFLCDLHIRFPPSIIDTIRKHCVEGYMAFAPIVLRLDCGVTPSEARGYWEVNGFGLLGIYKSDLVAAGGMNTREFTEQWGGEDWELLDRILQAGLEVERIFLRNFFHHYHSKRGMWNRQVSANHK
ncbi:beta-1,4-N-acetylgalactosaminyltransferase 3 isoform X2 [Salarias fasciatus]|uniref:beta-1,4-N-acetylgalactosaminyltransferase 3 isoform X2 n=1 Tax=Salarias fasciatus TaxID=181472 RepID=UPI001176DF5E|nr:beta-1,4-N-acetylgalactosaminyltransferase 3-like isoform X2 [Salarias fasciatus]